MKTVVIGDTHFYNAYPSFDYLEKQFDTIKQILSSEHPHKVIFLGDIFHFRKPDPETIVRVTGFFKDICYRYPGLSEIVLIRGNHDTAAKSDFNPLTILDIFNDFHKVTVVNGVYTQDDRVGPNIRYHYIPHYDDENIIKEKLSDIDFYNDQKNFVFGHFGFKGCINPNGDEDSPLTLDVFKHTTFLGHIHKSQDEGNVHVVGTPYSTSFSEADNKHRYAVIDEDTGNYYFKDIKFGIRYLQFDLGSLEANKDFIVDSAYTTILRVYISHLLDQNSIDLRKKIMEEYQVAYVDIKFLPMMEDGESSSYRPRSMVFEINDELINNYLAEAKTDIPKDLLLQGLRTLKDHDT